MGKDSTGSTAPSKNQLNSRRLKKAEVPHGGVCTMCGQSSTSCRTGAKHEACKGPCNIDGVESMADYSILTNRSVGFWVSKDELAQLRDMNITAKAQALKSARVCNYDLSTTPATIWFTDGDGEPICYVGDKWVLASEVATEQELTLAGAVAGAVAGGVEEDATLNSII